MTKEKEKLIRPNNNFNYCLKHHFYTIRISDRKENGLCLVVYIIYVFTLSCHAETIIRIFYLLTSDSVQFLQKGLLLI